jgi:hypothetical protein
LVKDVASGIWSMQSRTAINAVLGYFSTWAITPICLRIFGAAEAGRIGMTFAIAMAVTGLANGVIIVRASRMSMLAAARRYHDLDREVVQMIVLSCGLVAAAALSFPVMIKILGVVSYGIAGRMQSTGLTLFVFLGVALNQASFCLAVYMRAHRVEPMVPVSIGNVLLLLGVLLGLGPAMGPSMAPIAFTAVIALFVLPLTLYIFFKRRRQWRAAAAAAKPMV